MISTVAVGSDGSETAAAAVKLAAEVARRFDAKLVLLGAFDSNEASRRPTDPLGEWSYNPEAELRAILSAAEEEVRQGGVDVTTRLDDGEDPAHVLVKLAEDCGADLLVVGNKGMQRRVLGSVPNTITHRAPCSVVVVKTT